MQCFCNIQHHDELNLYKKIDEFVIAYIDDILIYLKTEEDNVEHLKQVLQKL